MTAQTSPSRGGAAAVLLRQEFDLGFAQPENLLTVRPESMLALRFDTAPYALALVEIAELQRTPEILAVPSTTPSFLGLIAVRGALLPAYDLGAMLGHSRAESQAWMLLVRMPHAIAFVFDEFEGHRHIAAGDRAGEAVRDAEGWRPLIRLSSLIQILQE
jgi:chemotaxis signal transduction protein